MNTISSTKWCRVSKRRPCPICGKADWCMFAGDPERPDAAICARIESPRRIGEAGYLHVLRHDGPTWAPWRRTIRTAARMMSEATNGKLDFARLAEQYRAAVKPEALDRLALSLGVTAASLRRLGIGWAADRRAWVFPMSDVAGNVLGLRLRLPGGKKLSVRGGREGLFVPDHLDHGGRLLIAEGPTDTGAMLDLGFPTVGRPSCTGGARLLVELVNRLAPPDVVIVADADAPGQRGADRLAGELLAYVRSVRIITPAAACKDAREWRRRGATVADVQAAIDAAPPRRLAVRTTVRKRIHARAR